MRICTRISDEAKSFTYYSYTYIIVRFLAFAYIWNKIQYKSVCLKDLCFKIRDKVFFFLKEQEKKMENFFFCVCASYFYFLMVKLK